MQDQKGQPAFSFTVSMVRRTVFGLTTVETKSGDSSSPVPICSHFLHTPFCIPKGQDKKGCSYLLKWRCPRESRRPAGRAQGQHASGPTGSPAGCSSPRPGVSGTDLNSKGKKRREKTFENLISFFFLSIPSLREAYRRSHGASHTPSEYL